MKYAKALAMCGATLVAAVSIAATAHAESQPVTVTGQRSEYVTRYVSYADLNLASATDERVLNRRVGHAVNDVCDEAIGRVDESNFRACTYDSWDGARPQITRAVRRARDIALTGASPIAAVAITIDIGR
ncbi:MAG: UrcA family protein [Rhizomicrobium sp.]|jgi:UrcA family protein